MFKSNAKKRSYLCTPWKLDTLFCTVPDRLQLMAEMNPDKEVIIFVGEKERVGVTYRDIVDGASSIARKMVTVGIQKNEIVAIHDDKSTSWLCNAIGAQMCGAWPLHISFNRRDGSDVADVLKRSGCKTVITQPGDDDEYIHIMKNFVRFNDDGTISSKDVPCLNRIIFSKKPACLHNSITFDDILPSGKSNLPEIEPEDIAAIFCSSGSTGPPKLVPWSHFNLIAATMSMFEASDIKYGESLFCDKTFGWIGGYPREMIIGVQRVTNTTTFKEKSLGQICDSTVKIINDENCRHAVLYSTTIVQIMKGNYMMKPLRTIIATGGPISSKGSQLVGRLCEKFMNAYAATEVGVISLNGVTNEHEMKNYDTGKPIPDVEVKVVDTEGRLCEVGTVGEIYVRNRSSSTGHLHEDKTGIKPTEWKDTGSKLGTLDTSQKMVIYLWQVE
ncbi:hypothetical protein FSP39_013608 [Pinctada imbricata]|uniref:AMP-dependent synthetase/ligase domain-containing protein n=1 Tax=Pinctada imbricata TaxID=66713 RepID=A0AA88Y0F9_PINIB|nr:hypothetical protein FSP39_013608 [Pinctada imbricata]